MSNRRELVEQITREVLAQIRAAGTTTNVAGPEALPPAPATTPPLPEGRAPDPYPNTGAAPPDFGRGQGSGFRHPNPADSEDSARGTRPAERSPQTVRSFMAAGASRIGNGPGGKSVPHDMAGYIDHTLLKPDATAEEITKLCEEAARHRFASVCINPTFVKLCASLLRGTPVKVCTVVGFPLGATTPATKAFESRKAIREGAGEVDMVINVGAVKSGNYELVEEDIRAVVDACHESGVLVKVIIEAALLTDEEKVVSSLIAKQSRADFVKTSTGFASGGATLRDVAIMRATVGPEMGVKAAGGIRSYLDAVGMIEAGATRIGASAGVSIVQEARGKKAAGGKGSGGY